MRGLTVSLMAVLIAIGLGASTAQAEIAIATAGPLTGQYASFGEQMRVGAEMAVADINAAGGVLGQQLRLELGDDACDPKQAVAVANQMVNKGVVFMAGHFCSGSSIPASAVYDEEGIVQISPASTNPKLTDEGGPGTFRVCGRDDQQGIVAGNYIVDNFPGARIALPARQDCLWQRPGGRNPQTTACPRRGRGHVRSLHRRGEGLRGPGLQDEG